MSKPTAGILSLLSPPTLQYLMFCPKSHTKNFPVFPRRLPGNKKLQEKKPSFQKSERGDGRETGLRLRHIQSRPAVLCSSRFYRSPSDFTTTYAHLLRSKSHCVQRAYSQERVYKVEASVRSLGRGR